MKGFNSVKIFFEESSCIFLVKNWIMSICNFGLIYFYEFSYREDDSSKVINWF